MFALLACSLELRFLLKYELTSPRKTGLAKKLCHTRRENVVREFRAKKGEFSRHYKSCSRVPWRRAMQTNSCYFTCSIYYLNASPAAMSRYREIRQANVSCFHDDIASSWICRRSFFEMHFGGIPTKLIDLS